MNMWTVPFSTYLQFNGVKEGINEIKGVQKTQRTESSFKYGMQVEETIYELLASVFDVKQLSPQMDIGFGADLQISYKQGDKNYSFFADVTASQKEGIQYYSILDGMVENPKDAFSYSTGGFNLYFGIKERHASRFFYEKPIIVLYIERFNAEYVIDPTHIENIKNYLIMMHTYLIRLGYGARASKMIRPNMRRYRVYYEIEQLNKPEEWGNLIYHIVRRANREGGN